MAVKLSILIATMPSRRLQLAGLIQLLGRQYTGNEVEIITDPSMQYNIGAKRNKLLQRAIGEYIVFIDDDDLVSPKYISSILNAMGSDCIGVSGTITTNGRNERQWHISKDYGKWYERNSIYYRTPNHISPVRRELALQAGFPEIAYGEDYEYSIRLLPLLKTENIIKGNLYFYRWMKK
jgi:glycosyltransferase involved in cell wall biosynthesis